MSLQKICEHFKSEDDISKAGGHETHDVRSLEDVKSYGAARSGGKKNLHSKAHKLIKEKLKVKDDLGSIRHVKHGVTFAPNSKVHAYVLGALDTFKNEIGCGDCGTISALAGRLGGAVDDILGEYSAVKADINQYIENIYILREVAEKTFNRFLGEMRNSSDDKLKHEAQPLLEEAKRKLFELIDTQLAGLKNLLDVSVKISDKDLEKIIEGKKSLESLIEKVQPEMGDKLTGDLLSILVSGIGSAATAAKISNDVLEKIGMNVRDLMKEGSISDMRAEVVEKYLAAMNRGMVSDWDLLSDIMKNVEKLSYRSEDIKKYLESHKEGAGYYTRTYGKEQDYYAEGESTLHKSMRKRKDAREILIKTFADKLKKIFKGILVAANSAVQKVGIDIAYSDKLDRLSRSLKELRLSTSDALPGKDGKLPYTNLADVGIYALLGYNLSYTAQEQRKLYLDRIQYVIDSLEDLVGESGGQHFKDLLEGFKEFKKLSDEFAKIFESTGIKGMGEQDDSCMREGGADSFDLPPNYSMINGIKVTLDEATNNLSNAISRVKIRHNLEALSRSWKDFGKDYGDKLAHAIGVERQNVQKEHELAMKDLGDFNPKSDKMMWINRVADAKDGIWKVAEYVERFLMDFTESVSLTPDDLDDIQSMLDSIENINIWFDEKTGDKLCYIFELFRNDNSWMKLFKDNVLNKDDVLNKTPNYITWIRSNLGSPNPDAELGDDKLKSVLEETSKFFQQFLALKNVFAIVIQFGSKFSGKKHGGDELYDRYQATPSEIYQLILDYLVVSAFCLYDDSYKPETEDLISLYRKPLLQQYDEKLKNLEKKIKEVEEAAETNNLTIIDGLLAHIKELKDEINKINPKHPITSSIPQKSSEVTEENFHSLMNEIADKVQEVNNMLANQPISAGPTYALTEQAEIPAESVPEQQLLSHEIFPNYFMHQGSFEHHMKRLYHKARKVGSGEVQDKIISMISNTFGWMQRQFQDRKLDAADLDRILSLMSVLGEKIEMLAEHKMSFNDFMTALHDISTRVHEIHESTKKGGRRHKRRGGYDPRNPKDLKDKKFRVLLNDNQQEFAHTNQLLVNVIKALVGKFFQVIRVHQLFNTSYRIDDKDSSTGCEYRNMIATTRLYMGGANTRIISEALPLYVRIPLLIEFYRNIFNPYDSEHMISHKRGMMLRYGQSKDINEVITLIPSLTGKFSELLNIIFNKNRFNENGLYTSRDLDDLITEINKIYEEYRTRHNPIHDCLNDIVFEINRRYGVILKDEYDEYIKELERQYAYGNLLPVESHLDIEILPRGEESRNSMFDSDRYLSRKLNLDLRSGIRGIKRGDMELVEEFIKRIQSSIVTESCKDSTFRIDELVRSKTRELQQAKSESEKYKIVVSSVNSLGIAKSNYNDKIALMFHEIILSTQCLLLKNSEMIWQLVNRLHLENDVEKLEALYLLGSFELVKIETIDGKFIIDYSKLESLVENTLNSLDMLLQKFRPFIVDAKIVEIENSLGRLRNEFLQKVIRGINDAGKRNEDSFPALKLIDIILDEDEVKDLLVRVNHKPGASEIGTLWDGTILTNVPSADQKQINLALDMNGKAELNGKSISAMPNFGEKQDFTNCGLIIMFNQILACFLELFASNIGGKKIYYPLVNQFVSGHFNKDIMNLAEAINAGNALLNININNVKNILFQQNALTLLEIIKLKTKGDKYRFLETDYANIPMYLRDHFRAYLPIFIKLFRFITIKCQLINACELRGNVSHHKFLLDRLMTGCTSLINGCEAVLQEVNDDPIYMSIYSTFINDYKIRNDGRLPLMPLSFAILIANDIDSIPNSDNFVFGSDAFKLLCGSRLITNDYENATVNKMPWMEQLLEQYNISTESRYTISKSEYESIIHDNVCLVRHLYNTIEKESLCIEITKLDFGVGENCSKSLVLQNVNDESDLVRMIESGENKERYMVAGIISEDCHWPDTRKKAIISNILEMEIIPVNIYALMRDIPLIHIYVYSNLFAKSAQQLLPAFAEWIIDPYNIRAGRSNHYPLSKNPKFIADQIDAKVLDGTNKNSKLLWRGKSVLVSNVMWFTLLQRLMALSIRELQGKAYGKIRIGPNLTALGISEKYDLKM